MATITFKVNLFCGLTTIYTWLDWKPGIQIYEKLNSMTLITAARPVPINRLTITKPNQLNSLTEKKRPRRLIQIVE